MMKNKIKISVIVCTLLFTSACSIFPDYLKPNISTPEQWQAKLPHHGDVKQLTNWWSQFNDPVLVALIEAAQQDSPSMDKAVANIQSARASFQSASAQGMPSLTGSASTIRSKGGSNVGMAGSIIGIDKVGLDATWELDLFGGIKFSKQAAQARVEAKQYDWHQARVSLAAEVVTDYVSFRGCELTVSALQKAYDSRNETVRLMQMSTKAGFAASVDAALAEASTRASESSLIGQQAQCDNYVKSLVALTNLPESILRKKLSETQGLPQPQAFGVNTLPASLLTQRPDLASDERNLAAASADIGISKADLYPSISLAGAIGVQRSAINNSVTRTSTWSFGPSVSLPIFDGGKRKAQVTISQANFDIAMATYKQDVRNAVKEVEQALINLESATQRAQIEAISAEQYAKYFKAAELNWRSGGTDLLSLEDARRQMINADTGLITQQQNRVLYWVALYKAFGGDWQQQDTQNENSISKVNP